MEKKNYNVPEIDVLCVESDVITQKDSYNEMEAYYAPRISVK